MRPPDPEPSILVVDDAPFNTILLKGLLAESGHVNVETLTDSTRAAEILQSQEFDLVLLDLHMPGHTGFDLLDLLRARDTKDFRPVIVLTADASKAARDRALASGANDFLTKPFDRDEVILRVRNLLHTRALHVAQQQHTERLEAEVVARTREATGALREAAEMRERFIRGLSHELRTPLTVICGVLDVLARPEVDSSAQERLLAGATRSAHHLRGLVTDLLAVTAGETPIDLSPTSMQPLWAVVEQAVADLAPPEGAVTLELARVSAPIDPVSFERIVACLVDNAIRYGGPDPVLVTIAASDTGVLLEVSDRGPGLPDEDRDRLFQPFEQGDALREHSPGTGIGLPLVVIHAQAHGGSVQVSERPGGGTTFAVHLPVPTTLHVDPTDTATRTRTNR